MHKDIRRVAVLGAGVMGSGIAAHLANAGIPVLLLDIVPLRQLYESVEWPVIVLLGSMIPIG